MRISAIVERDNGKPWIARTESYAFQNGDRTNMYMVDNINQSFASIIEFNTIDLYKSGNIENGAIFIADADNYFKSITVNEVEGHSPLRFTNKTAMKIINFQSLINKVFEENSHQFRVKISSDTLKFHSPRQIEDTGKHVIFRYDTNMLGFFPLAEKLSTKLKDIIKQLQNIQKVGNNIKEDHLKFINYLSWGSYEWNAQQLDIPTSGVNKFATMCKHADYDKLIDSKYKIEDDIYEVRDQMIKINENAFKVKHPGSIVINIKGLAFNVYNPQAYRKVWCSVPHMRNMEVSEPSTFEIPMFERMLAYVHMVGDYRSFRNKLNRFQLMMA
jgi:hypothetical protein